MYAVLDNQDTDWVTSVLRAGADVNAQDNLGVTALMYVVRYNRNPEMISTLLKAGADLNVQDNTGDTALMYAEEKGQRQIAKLLKEAGAK